MAFYVIVCLKAIYTRRDREDRRTRKEEKGDKRTKDDNAGILIKRWKERPKRNQILFYIQRFT